MRYKGKHDKEKEPWSRSDKISIYNTVLTTIVTIATLIKELLD